jgi:hypothetical protein
MRLIVLGQIAYVRTMHHNPGDAANLTDWRRQITVYEQSQPRYNSRLPASLDRQLFFISCMQFGAG